MIAGKSKSKQLEADLLSNKPIIIATIQTFPHIMKAILTSDRLYGIVIDEGNTSTTASKFQATLALQANDEMAKLTIGELITQI